MAHLANAMGFIDNQETDVFVGEPADGCRRVERFRGKNHDAIEASLDTSANGGAHSVVVRCCKA